MDTITSNAEIIKDIIRQAGIAGISQESIETRAIAQNVPLDRCRNIIGNFLRDDVIVKSFAGPNRAELYTIAAESERAWGKKPGYESITDREVRDAAHEEVKKYLAAKNDSKDLPETSKPDVQPKDGPEAKKDKAPKTTCEFCGAKHIDGRHKRMCKRNPDRFKPNDVRARKEMVYKMFPGEATPSIPWHCMYCDDEFQDEAQRDLHETAYHQRPCNRLCESVPVDPDPPAAPPIEELVLPFDAKDDARVVDLQRNTVHTETVEIPVDHLHDEDDVVIRKDLEEHRGAAIQEIPCPPVPSMFSLLSRELVQLSGMVASRGYKVEDMGVHENNGLVQIKFRAQKVKK